MCLSPFLLSRLLGHLNIKRKIWTNWGYQEFEPFWETGNNIFYCIDLLSQSFWLLRKRAVMLDRTTLHNYIEFGLQSVICIS